MKQVGLISSVVALIGGAVLAAGGSDHAAHGLVPYQDTATIAWGKTLHAEYCAACHGESLQGQENWQIRNSDGRAKAPPHDETGHMWHHSDQQNFMITKHGMSEMVGNGYQSDMPGFQASLSDEEIIAILAYIKSEWPKRVIDKHNQINAGAGH